MAEHDIFISYRRKDTVRVRPLVNALTSRGLSVWFDQSQIEEFAPITDEIRNGLANSKALLAWYSTDYPKSRPCQMELTAAFIAAQRCGDPRARVWVVNPEERADHIHPVELRDEQHAVAPQSADDYKNLAERIAAHVSVLDGSLGAIIPFTSPPQYGQKLVSARHFVGRLPDLWRLHSALHGAYSAVISGDSVSAIAQLSGMGGIGKSLVAEEYALRFSAAYPGGIFWLYGLGSDVDYPGLTAEQRDAMRNDQFRLLATELGLDVTGLNMQQVEALLRATLGKNNQSFLWIVDDLASQISIEAIRGWLSPHVLGKTLITTRSREYEPIGDSVPLGVLSAQEAFELLCAYRTPQSAEETTAAQAIADDLGYHPLALAVCSRALQAEAGIRDFAEFRVGLLNTQQDELDLAAELAGLLPNGHERSVATTLLGSVRSLRPEVRDFLRIASLVAVAPIPPALVVASFAAVDCLNEAEARHRTALGLSQTENACLAERAENNAIKVHTLISRTIRFHERDTRRIDQLRAAIVEALKNALPIVTDTRHGPEIALEVLHARELCARGIRDVDTGILAAWVAQDDYERGAYNSAHSNQEQVLTVWSRILGEEHPNTLAAMSNLAITLHAQGDLTRARTLGEEVLAIRRRILGQEHPDTLASINNLAEMMRTQGDFNTARSLHELALAGRHRTLGQDHPNTLESMSNLALTLGNLGKFSDARALQEQVLTRRRELLGDEHPKTLTSMHNLAVTLTKQGDLAGAHSLQETAVTVHQRRFGDEHPLTLVSLDTLAITLREQGNFEGARYLQEKTLAVRRRIFNEDHPHLFTALNNLAMTMHDMGNVEAACSLQEQVLTGRRRIFGDYHPDTLAAMSNLAITFQSKRELLRARSLQEQALATARAVLGQDHPDTLTYMNNLAAILTDGGDLSTARSLQEQVLDIRRRVLGEQHPTTSTTEWNLFLTLRQMGDTPAATSVLETLRSLSKASRKH